MSRRHVAVAFLAAGLVLGGCQKEEPAPPPTPEPPEEREAALSPAEREALAGLLEQAPAEAVLLGAMKSPRAVVDGLNAFIGPEPATLASVGLAQFPPGALEMEKPVAMVVSMAAKGPPHLVFLAYVRDADRLAGLKVEGGIKRLSPGKGKGDRPQWFAMLMEERVALALTPEALKALASAETRFEVTDEVLARIGPNLLWLHAEADPLAKLVRPQIRKAKAEAEARAARRAKGEKPSKEVAFFAWLEDLLDQVEHLELALAAEEDGGRFHAGLTFREGASALAVARSLKPIEDYRMGLPPTDRFFSAAWVRMDHAEAGKRMREFLGPPVEMLLASLDEMIAAAAKQRQMQPPGQAAPAGPPKGLSEFGNAVKDLWALVDEQGDALGQRTASLAEIPEPGQGVYAVTTIYEIKDSAAFDKMVEKTVSAGREVLGFVLGQAAKSPAGPKLKMELEYQEEAETIADVSVDVIRFDLDIQPPPGAPPGMQDFFKNFMEQIYGPEGLKARVAVAEGRAVVTLGPKDVMARALANLEDGARLASRPAVRRALARAPEGSRYVGLLSMPAYAYTLSRIYGNVFSNMSTGMGGISFENVPLPKAEMPGLGEPILFAVGVEDRTVRLDVDVPASELSRSILPFRHAMSRGMLFAFQTAFSGAMEQARGQANHAAFMSNLKQLGTLAQIYAADRDGSWPHADKWQDAFRAYDQNLDRLMEYPGRPGERAVAMNAAVAGCAMTDCRSLGRTVLFFECRPGAPSAGGQELLPEKPRNPHGYVICFCDGHVDTVPPERIDGLIWRPEEKGPAPTAPSAFPRTSRKLRGSGIRRARKGAVALRWPALSAHGRRKASTRIMPLNPAKETFSRPQRDPGR